MTKIIHNKNIMCLNYPQKNEKDNLLDIFLMGSYNNLVNAQF